ncbi:MAG: DDE-type integrase/transposase/recombinase [Lachnospiraceae bacterium]
MYRNSICLGVNATFLRFCDMNTNEIISYNLSTSPNMEQIKDMLNKAFERFPSVQGLIMHSDQGWQYQHAFTGANFKSMELYNLCPERATAMTTALWRLSLAG